MNIHTEMWKTEEVEHSQFLAKCTRTYAVAFYVYLGSEVRNRYIHRDLLPQTWIMNPKVLTVAD